MRTVGGPVAVPMPPLTPEQAALVESHHAWALTGAGKYIRRGVIDAERDEMVSAALFGLVVAASKFDPSRGFSFKTYAMQWTESYLRLAIRRRMRADGGLCDTRVYGGVRMEASRVEWPVDDQGHPRQDAFAAPEGDPYAAVLFSQRRAIALSGPTDPRDRYVLQRYLEGAECQEIAQELGCSTRLVMLCRKRALLAARAAAHGRKLRVKPLDRRRKYHAPGLRRSA